MVCRAAFCNVPFGFVLEYFRVGVWLLTLEGVLRGVKRRNIFKRRCEFVFQLCIETGKDTACFLSFPPNPPSSSSSPPRSTHPDGVRTAPGSFFTVWMAPGSFFTAFVAFILGGMVHTVSRPCKAALLACCKASPESKEERE